MRDRVAELRQLLNEWDFIGVVDPESNTDEYDCMIQPLLAIMSKGADRARVQHYLDEEITNHFGFSPGMVTTAGMADRLVTWWDDRP